MYYWRVSVLRGGNAIVIFFFFFNDSLYLHCSGQGVHYPCTPAGLLPSFNKSKVCFVMKYQLIYWNQNFRITHVMCPCINFTRFAKHFSFKAHTNAWTAARDEAGTSEHSWFNEGVSAQHSN